MEAACATSSALQVDAITTEESGFQAACELRARGVEFDAIVAASDLIAIGALRALQEAGSRRAARRWRSWASTTFPPRVSRIRR